MAGINNLDYSSWANQKAIKIAQASDTDGVKGLQGKEVFSFVRSAMDNSIEKGEIYELMGLTVTTTRATASKRASGQTNPTFDKAVNYYNDKMNSNDRYAVTQNTYTKLEERLYKMEHDIDQAYVDCDAYSDIMIVPRWHYRYYPRWEDNLINFDIADIRTRTSADMESLHELKDKVEYIMEEANGTTTHNEPEKTSYDTEALALKHLGMDYETFAQMYKDELDFCKTVTYADLSSMNSQQRMVYAKAKAYAKEMLQTTVNEAHKVNWDVGERKMDETLKASGDMFTISEFEYDGITKEGLSEIKSGIMYKAFEEALIDKYRELDPTGIVELETKTTAKKPVKRLVKGNVLIFNPDGSIYDLAGKRIK